ncbi:hypothetical protein [Hymenobacter rubripertinctus]|uniref:Uncharacterized protein n=1 Tax=Hymenobacter rubripertinctus TaxID=2029981 RepID=A0A418R5Y5_9BACT|nr:hypothetical protein [Hymenobacter rubripertinctus]RIY12863.1 hypothetical protein D0T11_03825 [Hymenobacter rubripertinctus]
MTNYSYFRPADLSALLTLEQRFNVIARRLLLHLLLSLTGLLTGSVLLAQGVGLFAGLLLLVLSVGLALWSSQRYRFEREHLWVAVVRLAEPATPRLF